MSTARKLTIDLATDEGNPIYVKDFRSYCRYVGQNNVSFHLVGSDYSISGSEFFTLPLSSDLYVSDTSAEVGFSIAGFSYTSPMLDFMKRNWQHWYEYSSGISTDFYIEASTDLQYLLSWEFDGIDASIPTLLTIDAQASVYDTKYDVPGELTNIWGDWGTHRAIGGDGVFYIRRDTDTSLNSFFSGMTRTTIVQGTFAELYFPGDLFEGYVERQFYDPDYAHLVKAATVSEVYLPDRNYLTSIDGIQETQRIGAGPFYPSLHTSNTNDSLVLYQPLLRDQSGAKVGGINTPSMELYHGGAFIGIYQLSEFLARPDAKRIVDLSGTGSYSAVIHYTPSIQICDDVSIEIGFLVPSDDLDPPVITGLQMAQRFDPGELISVELTAEDTKSGVTVEFSWRPDTQETWIPLSVSDLGQNNYSTAIQTSVGHAALDIKIRVTDSAGNYLEYIASNAALKQIPVLFDISPSITEIPYKNGDVSVILTGYLTDLSGNPLHSMGGVPLELMLNGQKVGMVLDEYISGNTHSHDGNIRFDWHFNPTMLFTSFGQSIQIDVDFDLGIYEQISRSINLQSIEVIVQPPVITLISPANNSVIMDGTSIDLDIVDDGTVTEAEYYLDGAYAGTLAAPWDIQTSGWADGIRTIKVIATDDEMVTSQAIYQFDKDSTSPHVEIVYPINDSLVPIDSILIADVSDEHLAEVTYSVNNGPSQSLAYPYSISLVGWAIGVYTISITAVDIVGHSSSSNVIFEIVSSTIAINLIGPRDGAVIQSGVPITFSVDGNGNISCVWMEGVDVHPISPPWQIATDGWSEAVHQILINATSDLGGSFEIEITITIDDTFPIIVLEYPFNGSYVSPSDEIWIKVQDTNFDYLQWTIWGNTISSGISDAFVQLSSPPADGFFTIFIQAGDLAGNIMTANFVFGMDSVPPSVSIANLKDGDAIRPGVPIDIIATDVFLSSVMCSVDNGESISIFSPHDFDTSSLSSGWHDIEIQARDASGKNTSMSLSFYVDMLSPVISVESLQDDVSDGFLTIEADVVDDYGIAEVILYYEREDGSFGTISMDLEGNAYGALLSVDLLWTNMSVYVVAIDIAGNSAESNTVSLSGIELPGDSNETDQILNPTPDESDETGNEESEKGGLIGWFNGFGMVIVIILALFLTVALISSKKRNMRDESETRSVKSLRFHENDAVNESFVDTASEIGDVQIEHKVEYHDRAIACAMAENHVLEDSPSSRRKRPYPRKKKSEITTDFDKSLNMVVHSPLLTDSIDTDDIKTSTTDDRMTKETWDIETEEIEQEFELLGDSLRPQKMSFSDMRRIMGR